MPGFLRLKFRHPTPARWTASAPNHHFQLGIVPNAPPVKTAGKKPSRKRSPCCSLVLTSWPRAASPSWEPPAQKPCDIHAFAEGLQSCSTDRWILGCCVNRAIHSRSLWRRSVVVCKFGAPPFPCQTKMQRTSKYVPNCVKNTKEYVRVGIVWSKINWV